MTSLDAGGIELACQLLRQEARTPAPMALFEAGAPQSENLVTMCSWCKQIKTPQHGWLEIEKAIEVMQLLSESPFPGITHAICESCTETLMAQ